MVRGDENSYPVSGKAKTVSNQSVVIYEDPPAAVVQKHEGTQTEHACCCSCHESSKSSSADILDKSQLDYKLLTQG